MTTTVRLVAAVSLWSLLATNALAQEKTRFASLQDALRASGAMAGGGGPQGVNWIEGGKRFSFTSRSAAGEEIRAFDPASGRDTLLFTARGHSFPGGTEPFEYDGFQWSSDSKHLVFQTHFQPLFRRSGVADYYVYSLADGSLTPAARGARTAELAPDGVTLGYERDGDLYAYDMAAKRETRLTSDALGDSVYNGHFDWVYEEEFGLAQAWAWSPDSRYIAFWQVDERPEPTIQLTDFDGRHPDWWRLRIPQPGDSNPRVRIGVSDVKAAHTVWLDPGEAGEYYVPRIYWVGHPDTLAMVTLNRAQNEMKLFFFDVQNGGKRLILTEHSPSWLDVYDFYARVQDMLSFPAGTPEFFWISDRDGWQHLYRYDYGGKLLNQVTHGRWSVTRVEGIDPKARTVYYTSTEASPLQRQLYVVKFDGTGSRRLTTATGTHWIDLSPDTRYYLDRWSSLEQPRQVELWATGGKKLKTFEDNARVTQWLATHAYAPTRIVTFTTADSARVDASVMLPVPFDSTHRYPVVFDIYGGPGSQQVYDAWSANGFSQWLAQQGYIVVGVNNRATNNYGSAFMKTSYRRLGYWEAHDFAETAKYLSRLPYVDGSHIGIMGTSYGGYSTIYTMEMYPEIFSVGIANSPVTDWRLYDSIYTERYMGLLADNVAGYDSSSAVRHAGSIKGHLLLIHSMMDDNVHPQNTMQFLTAAANAGVDVDLRIYPPGRHGAAYNQASGMLIRRAADEYLARYLKGTGAR